MNVKTYSDEELRLLMQEMFCKPQKKKNRKERFKKWLLKLLTA